MPVLAHFDGRGGVTVVDVLEHHVVMMDPYGHTTVVHEGDLDQFTLFTAGELVVENRQAGNNPQPPPPVQHEDGGQNHVAPAGQWEVVDP